MKYVLAFRGQVGRRLTTEEEARWPTWFEQIKDSIADFGSRVGQVREIGAGAGRPDVLSGYIIITADSLDAAATLADGCPGLQQGGSVEVGELVDACRRGSRGLPRTCTEATALAENGRRRSPHPVKRSDDRCRHAV